MKRTKHSWGRLLFATHVWMVLAASTLGGSLSAASKTVNPNSQDPTLAMAVHGEKLSDKLQDDAQGRYTTAAKALKAALEKEEKGLVNKVEAKAVGEAYAATQQMRRLAQQLQLLGESAGVDVQLRSESMSGHLTRVAQKYAGTPEGTAFLTKARAFLNKSQPERMNTIKRVAELLRKEQWREAETQLYLTLDKLATITVFMSPEEQRPIYEPFAEVLNGVTRAMAAVRHKESTDILQARLRELTPRYATLLKKAGAGGASAAKGPADFEAEPAVDGAAAVEPKTGPERVAAVLADWQQLHVSVQKFHALSQYLAGRGNNPAYSAAMPTGESTPLDPVVAEYLDGFYTQIVASLAKVIEADAAQATESDVPTLHAAYLQAIGLAAARDRDGALAKSLAPALQKLAAKSPPYAANVAAYDESTTELLRWRQRVAESQARARLATHPTVDKPFRPAFQTKVNYLGLFDAAQPDFEDPRLMQSAPDVLLPAIEQVVGQKATVPSVRAVGTGKNAVSVLNSRTYATLRGVRTAVGPAVEALKADLFVSDAAGPLTLVAASALATAEAGDWDWCGGTLTQVHLEGYVTRLMTLPDAAWPLVPLGAVAVSAARADAPSSPLLSKSVVRFDVAPEWVQHRYFLAETPSDEATAAASR
ncbi:MAG: hypothetical protein U0939_24890 [Pirellulales bacterium]